MFVSVFIPCRGILLIYTLVILKERLCIFVFIPCRGILLIYLPFIQEKTRVNVFFPCRGILLIYDDLQNVEIEFTQFSSPVGVFFLFIYKIQDYDAFLGEFSSPVGIFFLFMVVYGRGISLCDE